MTKPRATYRLQLRQDMTFERAGELAPYLERLGVRAVDFSAREAGLGRASDMSALLQDWHSGAVKLRLLAAGLALRGAAGRNIATADHLPLEVAGPQARHVLAFARTWKGHVVIAVVPRLALRLLEGAELPLVPPQRWRGTVIELPREMGAAAFKDAVTSQVLGGEMRIEVEEALVAFPVALLAG